MKRSVGQIPQISELSPQYIVDEKGKKTKIVIDLPQFEQFIEEIEDLYLAMRAQKTLETETEFVSQEEVEKMLGLGEDDK
jgi:predicted DNA-binding protein